MLPTDAVTDQLSGNIVRLQRVCEWSASGLGSIKLLNMVYKKLCYYGTCNSDSRYSDGKIGTVFLP